MEAGSRSGRFLLALAAFLSLGFMTETSKAGDARSQNFIVFAQDPHLAQAVCQAAEKYRRDLAQYWLGRELPPWPAPCPIRVVSGRNLAAQGVTTYNPSPVRDFQMEVVGTQQRILDSVLPHEVTHTVLATHFGRPLPRWADEGICTTVEHASERSKHEAKLREFLRSRRGIAMNKLFLLKEYPADILPMYAQGYSVCQFLIAQKGPRVFIEFLQDYMQRPSWTANVKKHYDYDSLKELQDYWLAWVDQGSQDVTNFVKAQPPQAPLATQAPVALASATQPPRAQANVQQAGSGVQRLGGARTPLALHDARGNGAAVASPAGSSSSPRIASSAMGGIAHSGILPPPTKPTQGTALASAVDQGWYQRRREGVANQGTAAEANTSVRAMVPPSVRDSGRYSSAQPQPEQRISRGGYILQP